MNAVLYGTGCPRCNVLKAKLAAKGIEFEECTDVEMMQDMGITTVPWLGVSEDDVFERMMSFEDAIHWINTQGDLR